LVLVITLDFNGHYSYFTISVLALSTTLPLFKPDKNQNMLQILKNWLNRRRALQAASASKKASAGALNLSESVHVHWEVNDEKQTPMQFASRSAGDVELNTLNSLTQSTSQRLAQDSTILNNAHSQWQFGDWDSLIKLPHDSIESHPERAKLALLVAAGHQQLGDMKATRDFVRLAEDWGCNKQQISRVLIAGVYNTLGKAALIQNDVVASKRHFRAALEEVGSIRALNLLTQARQEEESKRLKEIILFASMPSTARDSTKLNVDETFFLKFRTITLNPNIVAQPLSSTIAWQTIPVLAGAHYFIEGKIFADILSQKQALIQIEFLDESNETIFFESSDLSKSEIGYYKYIDIKKVDGCRFFLPFALPENCFAIRIGFRTWGDHSQIFYLESTLDLTINTTSWSVAHDSEDYQAAVAHYIQASQFLKQDRIIDAIKSFKEAENLAPQLLFPYCLMRKLGVYNPANLACINESKHYANPWAITEQLFITILSMLPLGATILELGSGTGTIELTQYYQVTSIEHDPTWLNKSPAHYIHAPLIDDSWYDSKIIAEALTSFKYDLLLVDGPPQHRRANIVDHFDLFDHDVPVVFDDIVRDADAYAMNKIATKLKRTPRIYLHGSKGFAVI